jgi:hypothetical protein
MKSAAAGEDSPLTRKETRDMAVYVQLKILIWYQPGNYMPLRFFAIAVAFCRGWGAAGFDY